MNPHQHGQHGQHGQHSQHGAVDAEEFWEEHYRRHERVWSGRANPRLVEVAGQLHPGTALDLGCGEGGDAIWLAQHGWRVTAVDIAATALTRVAADAADAGVADRIDLQRHDLAETLPAGVFDLVSAQYLQSPLDFPRTRVLQAAAGAVATGGLLLVVEHGSVPSWSWATHHDIRFPTPQELLASLDLPPEQWQPERLETAEREARGPDGRTGTVIDIVLAVKRSTG